ncbi:MAG TPA: transposase [Candidatus Polarisedimenticolaceae bacterium]|nr:transposase [Candidatus Polarisedimenticolaceae bacterium]
MGRPGPKKTPSYGLEFKRAAVQLSYRPGIQVQAVAEALDIHPYMLSRWRKEFREGRLRPKTGVSKQKTSRPPVREVRALQELEREHRMLQEEHALLKKAIRFCSEQKARRSRSSKRTGNR